MMIISFCSSNNSTFELCCMSCLIYSEIHIVVLIAISSFPGFNKNVTSISSVSVILTTGLRYTVIFLCKYKFFSELIKM